MKERRYTSENITHLQPNEVFVFGSNLDGAHCGGAARAARLYFGAIYGKGVGMQGQSYAIPTMHGGPEAIRPYVNDFIAYAANHPEKSFLVTKIGCGISGQDINRMGELFAEAYDMDNVVLPVEFVKAIEAMPRTLPCSWDSHRDFLNEYTPLMQEVAKGNMHCYQDVKQLRAKVYNNTLRLIKECFYHTESGVIVDLPSQEAAISGAQLYDCEFRVDHVPTLAEETKVSVIDADCLEVAINLVKMGYNPAVLNMANRQTAGGAVYDGAGAQEETIFRRTTIAPSLYQFTKYAELHGLKRSHMQYPMDRNYGGAYSPNILVFREGEKHGYKLMEHPVMMSFISVAALNRPDLTPDNHLAPNMIEPTKRKMRTIMRIGLQHNHDSLVLGALGCGAFRNPPRDIAELFRAVINEPEFKNKFKLIVFAIIDDHNSRKSHNRDGNVLPFKEVFNN
jgi:uncharacterized protein (TIGR02452 family)